MKHLRTIWHVLALSALVHLVVMAIATRFPELGDEPSFKVWATQAVADGIQQAYRSRSFGYDWLPAYLYVAKAVGLFYKHSGLAAYFGTYHHVLTLTLKSAMLAFHLSAVYLVYQICLRMRRSATEARWAATIYSVAPGTVLATAAFGYQDAFHTFLVVFALWFVSRNQLVVACCLTVAAALTKSQAILYLGPVWLYLLLRGKRSQVMQAVGLAPVVVGAILAPFIVHGTLSDVPDMYLNVPRVHEWLTGCAHNVWWLLAPAPPFLSDRAPIFLGINGLQIGLATFAVVCCLVAAFIRSKPDLDELTHSCAFLAFAFFMVITQIHENHLYACFPFLAIASLRDVRLARMFAVLTATFSADLVLTLYLLATDIPVSIGPVRLSLVNAAINVGALVVWTSFYVREWVMREVAQVEEVGQ